jgi:carnitine O-acetyltransferase
VKPGSHLCTTAYLEWREPLMVNSNWYILGQVDAGHPKELLANNGVQAKGLFSRFQIRRAAHMIRRGLEFKEVIDRYIPNSSLDTY